MKISSLGYTPANQTNQNYKNKQQNSPSFEGKISLIASGDFAKGTRFADAWKEATTSFIQKLKAKGEKIINLLIDVNNINDKTTEFFIFDPRHDEEGRAVVNELKSKYASDNISIEFENAQPSEAKS